MLFCVYYFSGLLHRNVSRQQNLKLILYSSGVCVCLYKMITRASVFFDELYLVFIPGMTHADFCVVAAVLMGCKQVLTGWLSYGCFPFTYCKCSLLLLFCHSLLPLHPFFLFSLLHSPLPPFRAGLQMSGFPKVSFV